VPLRTLSSLVDATSRQGTVLVFPVPTELTRLAEPPMRKAVILALSPGCEALG
jgi:hypothetical protein